MSRTISDDRPIAGSDVGGRDIAGVRVDGPYPRASMT
jgi:hypothetical protein